MEHKHHHHHRVFPAWMGLFLMNPLRKWRLKPDKLLSPYIKPGNRVLEIGPGMGFFTMPLARLVGAQGKVYALDIQESMLQSLQKRVSKKGLAAQVEVRKCQPDTLALTELNGALDTAVVFYVLHEMPDRKKALNEIYACLKPGGLLLLAEPGHVIDEAEFAETVQDAEAAGFKVKEKLTLAKDRGCVLVK